MSTDGVNSVWVLPKKRYFSERVCARLLCHLPAGCTGTGSLAAVNTHRRQSVTRPNMCGCCGTQGGEGARL